MSAADLIAVLCDGHLRYDLTEPGRADNDRLIFSKGHASPLLYACLKAAGAISDDELLSFRRLGSRLEGHPTPRMPWVDVATGSLGQGLPIAVGIALTAKRLDRLGYRVWTLCGDGELAEGSMWEAIEHASHERLDNVTLLVDVNRLGQSGETRHGWNLDAYVDRFHGFGWAARGIDGHDVDEIDDALIWAATEEGRPAAVVARTRKGEGVSAVDDQLGAHGKPLQEVEAAIVELGGVRRERFTPRSPVGRDRPHRFATAPREPTRYEVGQEASTRAAYGRALKELGDRREDVVALDADVSNSTCAELFAAAHPERFFQMYIAEQLMLGAAVGMQIRGWVPYVATFGAFLTRAYDFVRMAAISRANLRVCGSHAGVAIGEDGPSQMALEDLAAFRAMDSSTVLYPCDANQTAALVDAMADIQGISYIRTTRGTAPVIYGPDERFPIGGSKHVRTSNRDDVTLVGAGASLHEALDAADALVSAGITARVIDLYSVKPIDVEALATAAAETSGIVTVEDHRPEGGLGEAVLAALNDVGAQTTVRRLAVRTMVSSGTPQELVAHAGISGQAIATAATALVDTGDAPNADGDGGNGA